MCEAVSKRCDSRSKRTFKDTLRRESLTKRCESVSKRALNRALNPPLFFAALKPRAFFAENPGNTRDACAAQYEGNVIHADF